MREKFLQENIRAMKGASVKLETRFMTANYDIRYLSCSFLNLVCKVSIRSAKTLFIDYCVFICQNNYSKKRNINVT